MGLHSDFLKKAPVMRTVIDNMSGAAAVFARYTLDKDSITAKAAKLVRRNISDINFKMVE